MTLITYIAKPLMIGGFAITFKPMGITLASVKSKCPIWLIPALSINWAAVLSITPKKINKNIMDIHLWLLVWWMTAQKRA
jgi:hypothetical protein